MNALQQTQRYLDYPDTWKTSSIDVYERLYLLGKITQADINEIEERLQRFRVWRDYFATTGGVDEVAREQEYREAVGE